METQYYYAVNGNQFGPYTKEDLRKLHISPNTYVWHAGMSDWVLARNLGELNDLFAMSTPPPVPNDNPPEPPHGNNGLATAIKVLCIVGIVCAGIMHVDGWLLALDGSHDDVMWIGTILMGFSSFFLVYCILQLTNINKQLKKQIRQ